MKRLLILNGPNLNLLGVREPHIYGTTTLAQIEESCAHHAAGLGLCLTFRQSNHEGELVDLIQSARQSADAIIINPAGYSFTSIAILDAIKAFEGPVIEVHISNIHARDEYHRHSKISSVATGVISGLGPYSYVAARRAPAQMAKRPERPHARPKCCGHTSQDESAGAKRYRSIASARAVERVGALIKSIVKGIGQTSCLL